MYNPDNEKLVFWTKYLMICGGFWRLPITNNQILKIFYYIYAVIVQFGYFTLWLSISCELIRLIIYKYDWPIIATQLGVICNASKIMMKLIIYHNYNIPELFRQVIEKEEKIWKSNEEVKKMYKGIILICKFFITLLTTSTIISVVLLEVTGAIAMVNLRNHNRAYNDTLEPHFMYQSPIPRDKFKNLYWTFGQQILWSYTATIYNSITHIVFITLLLYAITQLKFLQNNLRNYLGPDFCPDVSKKEMEAKINILKKLVQDHQDVIAFVSNFNGTMQYIILVEFVLTSLDMALVTAMIIKADLSNIGWLLVFGVLLVIQISLMGWTCNEIKVQSEAIADAAFESGWHLLNKEGKMLIHLMMLRAQQPLVMTIGPFGPITINSVLTVIKVAYSYVSVMKE